MAGADNEQVPALDPRSVLATMAIGLVLVDRSWRMADVNIAAEAILGRTASELVGRDLWTEFPGARELEFGRVYESVMTTRRPQSFEAFYPGIGVWFEVRVLPTDEGIACYFLDITARREADERAAQGTEREDMITGAARTLAGSLDVIDNVASLAQLVVPYLGEWSIVSILNEEGRVSDVGSWHVDPQQRALVSEYSRLRLHAFPANDSFVAESARSGVPLVLDTDTVATVARRMMPGRALELLTQFAPQTLVVLPMVTGGRTVGLLTIYADQPWSAEQRTAADDIAARAALAIDNSLAYARAQSVRRQAEAANARLTLLADVGEALSTTDDPDVAVGRLARLVVPQLADWSVVTLKAEDGSLRDVGLAHRDPARQADLVAYSDRHLDEMTDVSAVATGLRTGQPVVVPRLSPEILATFIPDPTAAGLTRRLDPYGIAVFPLAARGRTFGVLTLATTTPRGSHRDDELATALEVSRRAGPVLESARAARQARRLAETIQRNLLTVSDPAPGLQVITRYRPAFHDWQIGGDWYDVFSLPDGTTTISIGDVMGHDLAAIAAMAQLRTLMRANAWTLRNSPAEILAATDDVSMSLGPDVLATSIVAQLAAPAANGSVQMRWSNAGHPPPVLVDSSGVASVLEVALPDPLLAAIRRAKRHDYMTVLAAGSTLLLYTDGLIERRERTFDAGLAQLVEVLEGAAARGLDELVDQALDSMMATDRQADDVAVLAVRVG